MQINGVRSQASHRFLCAELLQEVPLMKICFSTLGCPDFEWADVYSMAKDLSFDGIEIRSYGLPADPFRSKPFTGAQLPKTVEKLHSLRLEIPCISSNCCVNEKDNEAQNRAELLACMKLAQALGAPYVRVLGDRYGEVISTVDDAYVASVLTSLIPEAEAHDVTLLVESNGVYSNTKRLAALLDSIGSIRVAALWDMHHPYRFGGESPETTTANLGNYIKYVQTKDSTMTDGQLHYALMGQGDLPLDDMMAALSSIGYTGFVCLEWVKRWMPALEDAGIVFPQFADYMQKYRTKYKHEPQVSRRGIGQYPWPKERLINYTFPDVLDRICEQFPNQYAFRYTELDYTRTYPQFRDDVDTFARALIAMGVGVGDKVAIWATNVPAWYITFWATTKIGAVLVTFNTGNKIHETEYVLKQSDTHTLVMIDSYKGTDYNEIMRTLIPELPDAEPGNLRSEKFPFLRNVITVESKQPGCLTWDEAVAKYTEVPLTEVERRRRNVVNNGKAIGDCMDLSTEDRMMIQVPMFHCFGMVLAMTASVTHGVTMSPITAFSPRKGLDCINREKITCFHGVPTMFIAMLGHENFPKTDFSHMRTGIMAGSPCPIKTMEEVIEKMHMPEICITYGQTEASPATTMSKTTDTIEERVNTVGGPIFGVECKIVDPETGEEVPDGVDGEFCARGYNIMKGYYKMPEATAAVIDEDGWLHSGDLARRLPENGYFKITGRIKDMIIRGGENLYPKEIEDFLYTHPAIRDVQVIGVPDKQYGEEAMACVILNEGASATEEELKEYVRSHMDKTKVPRYVRFVDAFPMNAAGKILKYKMREEAVDYLNLHEANNIVTA